MQSERLFKEAPVWQAIGALVGPSVLSVLVMVIYCPAALHVGLAQTDECHPSPNLPIKSPTHIPAAKGTDRTRFPKRRGYCMKIDPASRIITPHGPSFFAIMRTI